MSVERKRLIDAFWLCVSDIPAEEVIEEMLSWMDDAELTALVQCYRTKRIDEREVKE